MEKLINRLAAIALIILAVGCSHNPAIVKSPSADIPPTPVLSEKARKDANLAYKELVEHYKVLRVYAKEQKQKADSKPPEIVCQVKFGDIRLPMIGLGEIHLVIISFCIATGF